MNSLFDFYALPTTPDYEPCVQAPYKGDEADKAAEEGDRFIKMLYRRFQNLPYGVSFVLRSIPYDTFYYYEVDLRYLPDVPDNVKAMLFIESNLPETWEDDIVFDVKKEIS